MCFVSSFETTFDSFRKGYWHRVGIQKKKKKKKISNEYHDKRLLSPFFKFIWTCIRTCQTDQTTWFGRLDKPVLVWCLTNDQIAFSFTSTNMWFSKPVRKQSSSMFGQNKQTQSIAAKDLCHEIYSAKIELCPQNNVVSYYVRFTDVCQIKLFTEHFDCYPLRLHWLFVL